MGVSLGCLPPERDVAGSKGSVLYSPSWRSAPSSCRFPAPKVFWSISFAARSLLLNPGSFLGLSPRPSPSLSQHSALLRPLKVNTLCRTLSRQLPSPPDWRKPSNLSKNVACIVLVGLALLKSIEDLAQSDPAQVRRGSDCLDL